MDVGLYRIGSMYCTVWCRSTQYRSYSNVYAVCIGKNGDDCVMRAHKVVGALANGDVFAGFLVKAIRRRKSLALLSGDHSPVDETMPRCVHWVIVEAESEAAAMSHSDVADVRDEILNPHPMSFCGVYFIGNGNGFVKVGHTANSLAQRLATLQAGSPHRLYVCASIRADEYKPLEKRLHKLLADKRMHGEWFAITDAEAIAIAKQHGGCEEFVGRNKSAGNSAR